MWTDIQRLKHFFPAGFYVPFRLPRFLISQIGLLSPDGHASFFVFASEGVSDPIHVRTHVRVHCFEHVKMLTSCLFCST